MTNDCCKAPGEMQTARMFLTEKAFRVKHDRVEEVSLFKLVPVTHLSVSDTQGEKNNGFDVLYHNMKHGQISSKELTDFIRER